MDTGVGCPHRPPCPGCPRFGRPGIARSARDGLDDLSRRHGLPEVGVVSGRTAGFRLRARLAIRGRVGSPKLGLFESATHRVVHIPTCSVQHPLINRVADVVRRALVETQVTCYSDKARLGIARYLQVVIERSSQTAQVTFVANSERSDPVAGCLDLIAERLGSDLHSLWFNANCDSTNTILGPEFHRWSGPPAVVERFGGAAVHYPPGAFGQSNLEIADEMIEHVRGLIPSGAVVAEFYAGVGAIGLSVLERVVGIRLNELGSQSLAGLELGCAGLEESAREKVTVVPGSAGALRAIAVGARVVIADPPRKGLDQELSGQLRDAPPERFIYISCGLESLARDVDILTAGGGVRLTGLTAFNLLPFTEHVETVAVFDRA